MALTAVRGFRASGTNIVIHSVAAVCRLERFGVYLNEAYRLYPLERCKSCGGLCFI